MQTNLTGTHYHIELIGVDADDHFLGFSAIETKYDEVFGGQGDNAAEAYDNALECMADGLPVTMIGRLGLPGSLIGYDDERLSDEDVAANEANEMEGNLYYYVAVYVKYPAEPDPSTPKSYAVFASPIGRFQTCIHVVTVEDCKMRLVGHRMGSDPIYLLTAGILYDNEQQHYPALDGETLFDYATRMTADPAIHFDISNPFN